MGATTDPVTIDREPGPGATIAAAILLVATVTLAYFRLFSTFMRYDDEGFMMATTGRFLAGSRLYDEVPTLYGPLYYSLKWFLHSVVGVPLTNDGVRWLGLSQWIAMAGLVGLTVLRATRRAWLAIIAYVTAFSYLPSFANEPSHPQEFCGLLIVSIAALVLWAGPGRPGRVALALGAAVGFLTMTKINVGIFATLAVLAALSASIPGRLARALLFLLTAAAILLPFALMRLRLDADWAWNYAMIVSAAVAGLFAASDVGPRDLSGGPARLLGAFLWGAVVAGILSVLVVLAKGTTLRGLVAGILILPFRLSSSSFAGPAPIHRLSWAFGLFSVILAALYAWSARRFPDSPRLGHAAVAAKFAFGVALLFATYRLHLGAVMSFATPFLWLLLIPSAEGGQAGPFPRRVLGWLAALQILQAYPIAGSQMLIGTFLYITVAAICVGDGFVRIEACYRAGSRTRRLIRTGLPIAGTLLLAIVCARAYKAGKDYTDLVPMVGPSGRGAGRIRSDEATAATYQWLVANTARSAEAVFCPVGLNSLSVWTRVPSPTKLVVGNTLEFYTDAQQMGIVRDLLGSPLACVVNHPALFERPVGASSTPVSPIMRVIREDFISCGVVDRYDFRVRVGRVPPVLVDCVRRGPSEDRGMATGLLLLTPSPGSMAYAIDLFDTRRRIVLASTRPVGTTPPLSVRTATAMDGPAGPITFADPDGLDLSIPRDLLLTFPDPGPSGEAHVLVLRVRDRSGRVSRCIPFLDGVPGLERQSNPGPEDPPADR